MELSINTQELQDKTNISSKEKIIFVDSMGVKYQIVRYIEEKDSTDGIGQAA